MRVSRGASSRTDTDLDEPAAVVTFATTTIAHCDASQVKQMLQEKLEDTLDTDVARERKYQKMMKRFEEVRMGSCSRSG